jgi:anti-anti-sigma regulatory factor
MNQFAIDRRNSVLLVTFSGAVTVEALIVLDDQMKDFIAHEGTMPTVIDFTDVSSVDANLATFVNRGKDRSLMTGQPRVFVAIDPLLFGLLRLYGTHQDIRGEQPPTIVHSVAEAFEALAVTEPTFELIAMGSADRDPECAKK